VNEEGQSFLITFEDAIRIAGKHRKMLLRCLWVAACLGLLASLMQPVKFKAKGSFQEGGVLSSSPSFSQLVMTGFSGKKENSAQFLMQSDVVLRHLVEELGIQVEVHRYFADGMLRNFWDNLRCCITGNISQKVSLSFSKVRFSGKEPQQLFVQLEEDGKWIFLDARKQILASGFTGEEIQASGFCLTINNVPKDIRLHHAYALTLLPWEGVVAALKKSIEIRPDRKDQRILWLSCKNRDARRAAEIVNQIGASFIHYLKDEEEKLTEEQLAYLNDHRQKIETDFDSALLQHVSFIKNNIVRSGFVEVEQQVDFLKRPQQDLRSRLVELKTFESNLKDVQATYAKTMGWPLQHDHSCMAEAGDGLRIEQLIEKGRFWLEQFAGIDLHTAKELHGNYQRSLDQIENQIDRIDFLLPKVREEDFELNAVSTLAEEDKVIHSLVQKASEIALLLREEGNYSQKDLQRLGESLKSQKKFIEAHLGHARDLYQKQAGVLQSKLASLREVMIKLIDAEKNVVQEQLVHLQEQLVDIPDRWRAEKQLEAKSELMQKVAEGMTQIIEGKIVDHHLKNVNSKMIDLARPPNHPYRMQTIKMVILFSVVALVLSYLFFFTRTLWRGFPLSISTAQAYGLRLAGKLSGFSSAPIAELPKTDLETMRRTLDFIEANAHPIGGVVVSVVGLDQESVSENLAKLLSWGLNGPNDSWKKKILIADLSFSPFIPSGKEQGFLQFIQGKRDDWPILQKEGFDWLPSGGTTRFATEIFRSDRFYLFLEEARQRYGRIFLLSETPLDASETSHLLNMGDLGIVLVKEESYGMLAQAGIVEMARNRNKATIVLRS
jgi:uncharacterized protein involved in exopolysaccharide biosynthesis